MKVRLRTTELNAIMYVGKSNAEQCMKAMGYPETLTLSMDGGLLVTDVSKAVPSHIKVPEGSWLVESKTHKFTVLSNSKFRTLYVEVV